MSKVRISEIATELGLKNKEVIEKANEFGLEDIKTHNSLVSTKEAEKLADYIMTGKKKDDVQVKSVKKVLKPKIVKKSTKIETVVSTQAPVVEEKVEVKVLETVEKKPVESSKDESEKDNSENKKSTEDETKEDEIKDNEVKNDETKDDEPKKETTKPVQGKASRAVNSLKGRRKGLTIVKKKKPAPIIEPKKPRSKPTFSGDYGKVSAEVLAELANRKKRNKNGATPAQKQSQGDKIELFGMKDFEISGENDGGEIVLLDFRDQNLKEEREEKERILLEEQKRNQKKYGNQQNNQKRPNNNRGKRTLRKGSSKKRQKSTNREDEIITHIEIAEDIRVYEFAEAINKSTGDVIKVLLLLGLIVTKNDFLDKDQLEILAEEFEIEITVTNPRDKFDYISVNEDAMSDADQERPPVITIMGHVDHGKTSLLDFIRNSKVVDKEAGGITQHIGAYSVVQNGKQITFLDTPGHAAFSAMRERGTAVTDIIIIVVAADDGVKPQTLEAIKHAKESGAPIIVAMNKMDKESANPDMVKSQLAEEGLTPIDWGGDTEFIPVSAKTGKGIDELLETILLQSEVLELKANSNDLARAAIIESSVEKGRGAVATVVVQNGTLKVGDNIVAGSNFGRVKAILDTKGKQIKSLGLSDTGVVVGLNGIPAAGEILVATLTDKEAKEFAEHRREHDRHKELSISTKTSFDELTAMIAEGNIKAIKVILRADVHGSLEAIKTALEKLRNNEVKINVISSGVGGITETDISLANNSENTVILGFNVRPTGSVKASAKQHGVEIKTYNIIYQLIDDMTGMLSGLMAPVIREENSGQAEVRDTFKIPSGGIVAGCMVVDGKLIKGGYIRQIREGVVLHTTTIATLRRFKDDVKEIGKGYDCGVGLDGIEDIVVGDILETFIKVEKRAKFESASN
jgi:translation initiation factor IF-2